MIHLRFSIDMEAEIIKITQKQHLNRVHFLVQLVRHALSHQPNSIGIWSKKIGWNFVKMVRNSTRRNGVSLKRSPPETIKIIYSLH